ncbi:hypothetical protein BKA82DRAFT_4222687 [Pisolithus tinctorius]|nr:hypothetical protein BKA82DRAFT_4222687 [Pisolithus tinctorius]
MSPPSPKMLLVFCDGTGADGTLTGTEVHAPRQFATNVLRLCNGDKPKRQIVLYLSGVGSESDFNGNFAGAAPLLPSKIRDAYAFIAQNFEVGDEICIFGGAYTARKLSGLIREQLGDFFKIWSALANGQHRRFHLARVRPGSSECVGVWDTVDAVYKFPLTPIRDTLGITDPSLPASIDIALHALSLQENRDRFLPTLWEMPKGGWRDNQVWFPGSHCDVGGGYEKHDLSDLALFWMVGEIKSFINIDTSFIEKIAQPQPDPWEQPNLATDMRSGAIKPGMVFHESILYAPQRLRGRNTCSPSIRSSKHLEFLGSRPLHRLTSLNNTVRISGGKQSKHKTNRNVPCIFEKVPESVTFESVSDLFP